MQELEQYLAEHPVLRGFTPAQIAEVSKCARMGKYGTDEYLFRAGEPARHCFLLREGHVAVEVREPGREPITLQTVGDPSALGWSWLVPPFRWCFDARAVELTRVLVLDAKGLLELCERDHDFGYEFMKRMTTLFAQRLHAARFQLLDVYANKT
ncbi:MAG: cyclic nucleotide-binding domain-containing protein [FCB group bacterium]|jgi:CRP-like cAMP-binding protein|nr:cyclic nucleotide-binding domain-containing protein [FCB group bacterium]